MPTNDKNCGGESLWSSGKLTAALWHMHILHNVCSQRGQVEMGGAIVGSPNVIVKSNGGSLPSISSIFTSLYSTLRGIVAQLRNAKNRVARSMNYNVESFNTYCVRRWAENPVG